METLLRTVSANAQPSTLSRALLLQQMYSSTTKQIPSTPKTTKPSFLQYLKRPKTYSNLTVISSDSIAHNAATIDQVRL